MTNSPAREGPAGPGEKTQASDERDEKNVSDSPEGRKPILEIHGLEVMCSKKPPAGGSLVCLLISLPNGV
jgi:hypothetical protein